MNYFLPNSLFLAPMSGITDSTYRQLMKKYGADIVITELISAESIVTQHQRTMEMLRFNQLERPIGLQLFGGNPSTMAKAAKIGQDKEFDFIDINLGCPMPKVVKKNCGSALLRNPQYLKVFLKEIKNAIEIPLTVKIRSGWTNNQINALENIQSAHQAGAILASIHGRSREQGYKGLANWELIKTCHESSPIPIIGNGDLTTVDEVLNYQNNKNAFAYMIGRGALINPFIFLEIKQKKSLPKPPILPLLDDYYQIVMNHLDKKMQGIKLAKIFDWFAMRYQNYEHFKNTLFSHKENPALILNLAKDFFLANELKNNFHAQHFLEGGHG